MDIRRILPDPSLDDNTSSQRRGSTSSTPSVSSAAAVSDNRSRNQRTARSGNLHPQDLTGAGSQVTFRRDSLLDATDSRRESASSMRTQSTMDDPVTYTPTTHRVSKAKKGKRVHACEYPGCGKVFTRAEHRRRHELNHSPEASFPCPRSGCRKAFHRQDLLARHRERHDLEDQAAATGEPLNGRRPATHQSLGADMSPSMAPMASPPMVSVPTQPHSNPRVTIGHLVNPRNTDHSSTYGHSLGLDYNSQPSRNVYPMGFVNSSDDSPCFFSSPESGQSPASDYYVRYNDHRNSMSSSSSVMDMYSSTANPLVATTMAGWGSVVPTDLAPSHNIEDDANAIPSAYQYPSPTWTGMIGPSYEENLDMPPESFPTTLDWL